MTFTYKKMYQRIAAVVLVMVMTVTGVFGVFPSGVFRELTVRAEDNDIRVSINYYLVIEGLKTDGHYDGSDNNTTRYVKLLRNSSDTSDDYFINENNVLLSEINGCYVKTQTYAFSHWIDQSGEVVSTNREFNPVSILASSGIDGNTYNYYAMAYTNSSGTGYYCQTNTDYLGSANSNIGAFRFDMTARKSKTDNKSGITLTAKNGYSVSSWKIDGEIQNSAYSTVKANEIDKSKWLYDVSVMTAIFAPQTYNTINITYATDPGGSAINSSHSLILSKDGYFSDGAISSRVLADSEHTFDKWVLTFNGKEYEFDDSIIDENNTIIPTAAVIKTALGSDWTEGANSSALNVTFTAKFKEAPKTYTVTYQKDTSYSGNGTLSVSSETFLTDGQNTLTGSVATPENGNGFIGWYDAESGELYTTNNAITNDELKNLSNADHTIVARFVKDNVVTMKPNYPEWGYIYYPNTETDNAYYIENGVVKALSTNAVDKNIRSPLTYDLTKSNEDLGIDENERNDILISLKNTTEILARTTGGSNRISNTVTARAFDGYAFIRWGALPDTVTVYDTTTKVDGYGTAGLRFAAPEDATVTAIFAPKYTVTYSTMGNGTISKRDTDFEYDNIDHYNSDYPTAYVTGAVAVPDEGWHFSHWEKLVSGSYVKLADVGADFTPDSAQLNSNASTEFRAVFVQYLPITYEVKKVEGGGGSLVGDVTSITEENAYDPTNQTLIKTLTGATAVTDEYSEFLYWIPAKAFTVIGNQADQQYVDGYTGNDLKSTNFIPTATDAKNAYDEEKGEIKFYAVFKEKETVSYKTVLLSEMDTENTDAGFVRDDGGSTVTKMLITNGTVGAVTAVANADYTFIEWVDANGTVVSNDPAFTASGAQVVNGAVYRAVFKENPYIAYEAEENGSITSGGQKEFVSKETFDGATAAANTGYTFDGWYVKGHESSGKVSDSVAYVPKLTDQTAATGRTLQSYIDADGSVTLVARFVSDAVEGKYTVKYIRGASGSSMNAVSDNKNYNGGYTENVFNFSDLKGVKLTLQSSDVTNGKYVRWRLNDSKGSVVGYSSSGEVFDPKLYMTEEDYEITFYCESYYNSKYFASITGYLSDTGYSASGSMPQNYAVIDNWYSDENKLADLHTRITAKTVYGYRFNNWQFSANSSAWNPATSAGTRQIYNDFADLKNYNGPVANIRGVYDFVPINITYTHTEGGEITKTSDSVTSMTGSSIGCEALPNEEDNYRFVGWKLLNASAVVGGSTVELTIPAADLGSNVAIIYTPEELVDKIKDLQYNNKGIYDSDPTKINATIQAVFKNDSSTITYLVGDENKINASGNQYFGKLLSKVNSKASLTTALEFSHSMGVKNQIVIPVGARPTYGCQFDYWTVTASPIEDFDISTAGYTAGLDTNPETLKNALKSSMDLTDDEIEVVGNDVRILRSGINQNIVFPVGYHYTLRAKFSQASNSYRIDYVVAQLSGSDNSWYPVDLTLTDRYGDTYAFNTDYETSPILTEFIRKGDKPVGCTGTAAATKGGKTFQFAGWTDVRENSEVILKYKEHIDPWDSLFVISSNTAATNGQYKIDVYPDTYTEGNVKSYKFAAMARNVQNTYLMYRVNNEQYGELEFNRVHGNALGLNVLDNINGGVVQYGATPKSKNAELYDFAGWVLQGTLLEGHTVSVEPDPLLEHKNYTYISAEDLDTLYQTLVKSKWTSGVPQTVSDYSTDPSFSISSMTFYHAVRNENVYKNEGVPVITYNTQGSDNKFTANYPISWYINYTFNQTHSDLFSSDDTTKQAELNRINGSGKVTDVLNYAIAYFEPKSPYIAINYKVYNADAEKGFVHEDYTVDTWFRNDSETISVTGRTPLTDDQINAEIVGTHALTKASDDAVYIFKDWIDDTGTIVSTDPDFRPDNAFLSQVAQRMGGEDKIPYVTSVTGKNVRTLTFYARFEVYTEADVTYAPDDSKSVGNSVSVTEETNVNIRYGVDGSQAEIGGEDWSVLGWNDSDNSMISYMDDFAADKPGLKKWVLTASPEYQHYKEAWEYYWTEKQAYINDHGSAEGFTMESPTLETIPYTADFIYDPTTSVTLTKYAQSADRKTNTQLQGAKFAIYRVGDDGNALKGIGGTGSYRYQTTGDKLTAEFVTDANGKIVIQDLPLGNYYFKETEAPTGYDKCENVYFELTEDNRSITDLSCYDKMAERTLTISKTIDQYYPQFGDATFIFHITSTINGANIAYNKTITFDADAVSEKTAPYTLTETITVPAGNYTVTELETARYTTDADTATVDLTTGNGTVAFENKLTNYALYSHNAAQVNEIGHFRIDDHALAADAETAHSIAVSTIAGDLSIDHSEISGYAVSNLSFEPASIDNGTDKIGTTYSITATYSDDDKGIKIENIPFHITVQPAGYTVTFHSIANRVNEDGVEVRGYFNYDTAQKKLVDTVENGKTYLKYEQNTLRYLADGTKSDTNVYTVPTLFESYLSGGASNYNFYSYQFSGWIDSNGNSWTADSNGKLNKPLTSDLDLYPTFTRVFKLTYLNNNGNGSETTDTQTSKTFTITSTTPTRTGFTFVGWSTSASPGENDVIYQAGDATRGSITIDQNTTLYAVWKHDFTLTYCSNYPSDSGSGSEKSTTVSPVTYAYTALTAESAGLTVPGEYKFVGWSTSEDATAAEYVAGSKIETGKNTTLYAVWKKEEANGGT